MAVAKFMSSMSFTSSQFALEAATARQPADLPSYDLGVPGLQTVESKSVIGHHDGVLDDDLFELFGGF